MSFNYRIFYFGVRTVGSWQRKYYVSRNGGMDWKEIDYKRYLLARNRATYFNKQASSKKFDAIYKGYFKK